MKKIAMFLVMLVLLIGLTIPGCNGGSTGNGGGNGSTPPPSPAAFSVSNLTIYPSGILPGETIAITATVRNTGGTQGSYNAVLKINGVDEGTEDVTLSAGGSQGVTFSLTRADIGTYEVTVGDLSGSFAVMSAEMIIQAASEAMAEISTYQFDIDMEMTVTNDAETSTSTSNGNGVVNIAELEAYQLMEMYTDSPEYGTRQQTEETYLAGGWVYERRDFQYPETPVKTGTWRQDRTDEDYWKYRIYANMYLDIYTDRDASDFELLGTEILDGVECYKLRATYDMGEAYEDSVLLWVARDTHFIMKILTDTTMTYEQEMNVSTMTLLVHHINEPVTIEVPLEATEVTFPDPNLETVILEILNKAKGPIYLSDLEIITVLEAQDRDIRYLDGLECCINLQTVNLADNSIYSIRPLVENDGLSTGDTVDLMGNPLSGYSQNYDIPELRDRGVTVGWTDVAFPDPNLEAAIREAINKPDGLIYIPDLERVTMLTAREKGISDLTGLEYCVNLKQLYLSSNYISDISPLAGLINLQELDLGVNTISDISALTGLTNLKRLYLYSNNISDISPLAGLINLQVLDLGVNTISDISPLAGLTNVELLRLWYNNISDISPLAGLINLKQIELTTNNINDISPLAGLINLKQLDLWDNNISDISALTGLTNLKMLHLYRNNISDISPLAGLTNLQYLWLGDNNISNISSLLDNSGLSAGDTVGLENNPLSSDSVNIYIPQLEARGVEVILE